eukprot:COSAG05_NODE_23735_length_256_cov_0.624204_1_plen_36_part_01
MISEQTDRDIDIHTCIWSLERCMEWCVERGGSPGTH